MAASTILSYLNVAGAVACFIVPIYELLFKKNKDHYKGLQKVSNLGWTCLCVAVYVGILSLIAIPVANKEKKQDADSLRTDFKNILKENNLEYNASTGKVINITNNGANGITTISADNIYGINVNPINDSNTGITNPIVSIGQFVNPFKFLLGMDSFRTANHIPYKSIYLISEDNTNGRDQFTALAQLVSWDDYTIYGTAKTHQHLKEPNRIYIDTFRNRIALYIGNFGQIHY